MSSDLCCISHMRRIVFLRTDTKMKRWNTFNEQEQSAHKPLQNIPSMARVAAGGFGFLRPTSYTTCRVLRIGPELPQRACCFPARVPEVRPLMRHTQDRGFFPIFQFPETTHRAFFCHSSRRPDSSPH